MADGQIVYLVVWYGPRGEVPLSLHSDMELANAWVDDEPARGQTYGIVAWRVDGERVGECMVTR